MGEYLTSAIGDGPPSGRNQLRRGAGALVVTAVAALVFWRTAYPTIHWWDSAEYSLAAATRGIVGAPGSLLLTLLGWPVAQLPVGSSPAHVLNLLAGLLAALVVVLVYVVALHLPRLTASVATGSEHGAAAAVGAALGALTFAFSATLWEYANQFTPYVLSAVFTAVILWVMLGWWAAADQPDAWRRVALLGLLFGLDFSVHRTNALLLPGALAWILVRRPRTLLAPKALIAGVAGLLGGLAVQLLDIPVARAAMTRSPLFWNDPTNLSRFWHYVSLERVGGGFLIDFFPRKGPFWSVQVADVLHVLGANFLHWNEATGLLGVLAAAAAALGLVALWRHDRRLGIGYSLLLFLQAIMTVLYFNIPAHYFRTFDRHYLPICVRIAVLIVYGLAVGMETAVQLARRRMWVAAGTVGLLAGLAPIAQEIDNWTLHDASQWYFTKEFATNLLMSLPRDAILFTAGDNDTFPLQYFQAVEGVRQDVTIVNLSVANLPTFAEALLRRDPSFPLALSPVERAALGAPGATPKTVTIPVVGHLESLDLPAGVKPPTTISDTLKPAFGTKILPAEITVLDIVRTNRWQRPLCFATTGTRESMRGLAPYGRLEGLYYRVVPVVDPPANVPLLRLNLLERADYRGYADPALRLDNEDRTLALQSYVALTGLLEAERKHGDIAQCRTDAAALFRALPPARLEVPAAWRQEIISKCRPLIRVARPDP